MLVTFNSLAVIPSGRTILELTSLPVTGFLMLSRTATICSPALNRLFAPSKLHSKGTMAESSQRSKVGANIGQGFPPSSPFTICSRTALCSFEAFLSMNIFAVPFPSWMDPGHLAMSANARPSNLRSPQFPVLILNAQPPSQCPYVGGALKLQGHPSRSCRLRLSIETCFCDSSRIDEPSLSGSYYLGSNHSA